MKKVISFSVYGNNPVYYVGIIENLKLRDNIYPDWWVYIYYDNFIPNSLISKYSKFPKTALFNMSNSGIPGMFWRFLPFDDV